MSTEIKDMTEREEQLTEAMQKEMWAYAEAIIDAGAKTSYQDICTVFLLMKIVQLQEEISYLKHNLKHQLQLT